MNFKIPVIDIFAGPGGLGEGFASLSDDENKAVFEVALSVEKDPVAHKTLELRSFLRKFSSSEIPEEYYQYLRKGISRGELFERYPKEAASAKAEVWCENLGGGDELNIRLDARLKNLTKNCRDRWVLIGGPPCQAYSTVGRSRRKNIKEYSAENDERSFLYLEYLRILAEHQPAVFVMENVKGMLSSKINGDSIFEKILEDLKCPSGTSGKKEKVPKRLMAEYYIYSLAVHFSKIDPQEDNYSPSDFILKSEKYGIPQARHRVILLGVKKGLIDKCPEVMEEKKTVCAKDVLDGLPPLRSGLSREKDSCDRWKTVILETFDYHLSNGDFDKDNELEFKKNIINALDELETLELCRGSEFVEGEISVITDLAWWYIDDRLSGACNHYTKSHMDSDLHRYLFASCFAENFGRSPRIHEFPKWLIPKHKSARSGHFPDRFRVQQSDHPSTTITSHISKDGHYFIHYNPVQCRSLTVREAARLQTFPDNYFFEGNRSQQYVQVGNAVPPLLARKIAVIVKNIFFNANDF